jgi:hypothetical protein
VRLAAAAAYASAWLLHAHAPATAGCHPAVAVNDRWGAGDTCKHGSYWTCTDRYK